MLNIDGTEYYTEDELVAAGRGPGEHVIAICDRGWIFEGRMSEPYRLADAHVVRRWDNGLGIGGLQTAEHRGEYELDALPGGVELSERAVIALLPIAEW